MQKDFNNFSDDAIPGLVEEDRVHRSVYTDPRLFELEMERIWKRSWVYVGHDSQIPKRGDYLSTEIAREPVILVRHGDGSAKVLFNRCAHKGAEVVTERTGNVRHFYCNYHGWTYGTDGKLANLPLKRGYEGTCFDMKDPQFSMRPVPRIESYRGFIFASLATEGPDLRTFLGPAVEAFDDMCDRSPEGQVVAIGTCARTIQHSNWKLFLENQLDVIHAGIVHLSSWQAARRVAKEFKDGEPQPLGLTMLQAQVAPDAESFWEKLLSNNFRYGHSNFLGYQSPRGTDPVVLEYEALLRKTVGKGNAERFLARNFHHTVIYPCLSLQSSFQQVRVVKPITVDRTLMEIWHFRLAGVPKAYTARNLCYANIVNSPGTIISCDDYETWRRCHEGLKSQGSDWVSIHRNAGGDLVDGDIVRSRTGSSEAFQRNQYAAWRSYMMEP